MRTTFIFAFCVFSIALFSQQTQDLVAGKSLNIDGIEYGYDVRNETEKNTSSGSSSKYVLSLYVVNRSGCTKYLWPKQTLLGESDQNVLADFECINATGQRFTEKSQKVRAADFFIPVKQTTRGADGKDLTRTVRTKVGHILREGQSASAQMTVIVPNGQEPKIKVRIIEAEVPFGY
jgi:hypothetical protein